MKIDHIFIFTTKPNEAAQELFEFGLTEGSSRSHQGQGTANRKFYFGNFFIELLYVVDEVELKSETTRPSKLWERSKFETNKWSPFGLVLVNDTSTDKLFSASIKYLPSYFPDEMWIDVITNENQPQLPSIFRLPYRDKQPDNSNEPIQHQNGIRKFSKAVFQIPGLAEESKILSHFPNEEQLHFINSTNSQLVLNFDDCIQSESYKFKTLPLTINY